MNTSDSLNQHLKKVLLNETGIHKKKETIVNVRSIFVFATTKVSIGLCLSSMGVVFTQEDTSRLLKKKKNNFFVHGKKSLPSLLCILTVGL